MKLGGIEGAGAAPIAEPIWRIIEFVPEASPETSAGMSASTTLVNCAVANPTPRPYTKSGGTSSSTFRSCEISVAVAKMPIASRPIPRVTTRRGP